MDIRATQHISKVTFEQKTTCGNIKEEQRKLAEAKLKK